MTEQVMAPTAAEANAAAADGGASMQPADAQPTAEPAEQNAHKSNLKARAYQQDLVQVALENNVRVLLLAASGSCCWSLQALLGCLLQITAE
jgi:hypothetical protein